MNRVLATFPYARQLEPSSGKGRFLVYLTDQAHPALIIKCLMLNDELVGMWTNREWDSRKAHMFEEALELEMELLRDFTRLFDVELLLSRDEPRLLIESKIESAGNLATALYRDFVARITNFSKCLFGAIPEPESNLGLRSLFKDGNDLDAFSLISICNDWTTDRTEIQRTLREYGYDLARTIHQIEDIQLRNGVCLLAKNAAATIETAL